MPKTSAQIEAIKKACAIWKQVKQLVEQSVKPGMTTAQLDELIGNAIFLRNATPTFLNYHGFKGNACISINEELIHGVPGSRVINDGDMITFDVGVTYQGHVCDAAFTVLVGNVSPKAQRINELTKQSLQAAIAVIKEGVTTGTIGAAVQRVVEKEGYHVVKDFTGHGCGTQLHEPPAIPNYGKPGEGIKLVSNEVVCIEPMVLTNSDRYVIDKNDGWTVKSTDNSLTCHWEHMILVTKDGCEVLTA